MLKKWMKVIDPKNPKFIKKYNLYLDNSRCLQNLYKINSF